MDCPRHSIHESVRIRELAQRCEHLEVAFEKAEAFAFDRNQRVGELEAALKELAGYVRAHLAGNDADPELLWALELADEALA